jgi:hypothetical protein
VLLELKKEALSKGAVVKENTEVFKLGFNKKLSLWEVHTSQLTHREDIRMHLLMLEENNDNDNDVNDGDINHGRRCCVNESSHSATKSNENVETTTQRTLKYQAKHVVIASGGRSEGIAKLASRALFNQQPDEIQLPVIPVVGQMFRLSHERRNKENLADVNPSSNDTSPPPPAPVLNHMICGTESEMFWDNQTKQGVKTHPPNLTHERRDDDDDDDNDDDEGRVVSGGWKPRQVRHLYGKQTHDGSFIFGGDRRVKETKQK